MKKANWSGHVVTIVIALVISLFAASSVCADPADELYKKWAETAKSGSCGPGATYTVKGDILTISGKGELTKHFDDVFGHFIKTVVIEDGITSICDYNLVGLYINNESEYMLMNIRDYYVPLSVSKIGDCAIGYYWVDGAYLDRVPVRIHTSKKASEAIRYANTNGFELVDDYQSVIDMASCNVSGLTSLVYTGSPRTQNITVTSSTTTLIPGTDYTVSYENNTDVGIATIIITGKGEFAGTIKKTFEIVKAANPMTVKVKTASVKYANVKKKKQTVAAKTAMKISKNQGPVSFTKTSGNKKITISKKTGRITIKKGLKKGTYKVKIIVSAAGNRNFEGVEKKITLKIKIK